MKHRSLLRAGRLIACLAYIMVCSAFSAPGFAGGPPAAPAVVAAPSTAALPIQEATPPVVMVNLDTANPLQPVHAPLYWRLDKTGRVTPEEVLSPAQQSFFTPFPTVEMPKAAGTSWFRFTLAPYSGKNGAYYLDLNSRVADQIPKVHRVWLLREGQPHIQLHTEIPGLYMLPDSAVVSTIFVRTEGLPAIGFAPTLRNTTTLTVLDTDGAFWIGIVLAVALAFGLLRGIFEQREWRMWAALYAGTLLVTNVWGFPATPDGRVLLLDLPGLLAPGVALLLLPHVGRHILRSREHSGLLDIQFILIGLLGLVLCLLPMLSNHVWTIRYLPLWPLGMLLLLPTTFQALFKKINGSWRFLIICLLPPLGLLSFAPLPIIQFATAEDAGLWSGLLSLLPSVCLCASSLLIAIAPTPKHEIKVKQAAAKSGQGMPSKVGGDKPLTLDPKVVTLVTTPPLVLDDASRMTPPADVDSALPLHNLERRMRGPLDVLLNEIGTLEQMNLPRDLVDHAHRLSRAGRQLSLLIGEISSGRHASPVVIRQKSGAENATQVHAAPFDLYEVILQAHNAVAELAEAKNLALSWFTAPHLARTYSGQGDRLLRVLTLLAESAVHATDRGIVQIRVQRLAESNDPGMLQFTVSDTGKGAPPLQRSSISLVQVWELVGPMGGTLNVESGPTGTSIAFTLRFQALSAENAARSLRDTTSPALRSDMCNALRILVISDIPGSRQLLSYYLDELPHEVREARSVEEALGMYMQAPGALLIFDGDLPETDVVRAIAAIRSFEGEHGYPLASILALVKDDDQIERLRRAGCTHSLLKPVSRPELRQLALRLAPVPRSRTPYRKKAPAAPLSSLASQKTTQIGMAGNASAKSAVIPRATPEKHAPQKDKGLWSKLSPLSLDSRDTPEARTTSTKTGTLPPLAPVAASSVPTPTSALSKASAASTASSLSLSAPATAQHIRPASVSEPRPVSHTTAQILDEMVRDAEEKVSEDRTPDDKSTQDKMTAPPKISGSAQTIQPKAAPKQPAWKVKQRQNAVHKTMDTLSAERKPMPWPGTRPRRSDIELSSPYVPGASNEWVSDARPVGSQSTSEHNDHSESTAIMQPIEAAQDELRTPAPDTSRLPTYPQEASPEAAPSSPLSPLPPVLPPTTEEKTGGLVGSLLSAFKKQPQHSTPQLFASTPVAEEWVGEPRPVTRRAEPLPTESSKGYGMPHPKEPHYAKPASPEQVSPLQELQANDPLAPVEYADADSTSDSSQNTPLPNTQTAAANSPTVAAPVPASPLARRQFRKATFQPLLLSGLEPSGTSNGTENAEGNGLELRFSTAHAEPEEIFNLTEIVDDAPNLRNVPGLEDLPELPQDSGLKLHQPEPSTLYLDENGTPQHDLHEEPEIAEIPDIPAPLPESVQEAVAHAPNTDNAFSSEAESEMAALRRLPGTPLPDHPGLELVEFPDEPPVQEQLERLETLSARAQDAFATDDVLTLRETAAKLAETATALGMHGLIDLAHCLEEVAGDPEATASLLETIETAVRDEQL